MAGYNTIRYEHDDGLLRLTLNRPQILNAFTIEMSHELVDAYTRANADDAVQAIVVTGEGKGFCAGMDLTGAGGGFGLDETLRPTLEDMRQRPPRPEIETGVRDASGKVSIAMFDCLKPIVGAINGAAVGVGASMLLPMDFRLASEKARIGFVFGKIGAVAEACSTWFLPRIVGVENALELVYTAEIMTAERAKEMRLVRSIHSPETLLDDACGFARCLVRDRSPVSTGLMRQMILRNSALRHPRDANDIESLGLFYQALADAKEGIASFMEKRPPRFTSRASADMPPFYPWERD